MVTQPWLLRPQACSLCHLVPLPSSPAPGHSQNILDLRISEGWGLGFLCPLPNFSYASGPARVDASSRKPAVISSFCYQPSWDHIAGAQP